MKRIDCLRAIAGRVGDALVVASAGGATVEWYDLHPSGEISEAARLVLPRALGSELRLAFRIVR